MVYYRDFDYLDELQIFFTQRGKLISIETRKNDEGREYYRAWYKE